MSHEQCESRCFAPPHPALLARTRVLQSQGSADTGTLQRINTALPRQSGLLGLNDGTIFPKSHFIRPASVKKMAAVALVRAPLRNAIRVIIVLVDFQDVRCPPGTIERTQDLWFSTGGVVPNGSVTEFYSEVSNKAISLTGEVIGPFTLKEDMAYYANNQSGMGWPGPNSQTMADEALQAASSQTDTDFKSYDNDGNGYVDAFVVVHAGRDAAETGSGTDIWSVKWVLPQVREANDVKIFGFLTVPADAKCGVCAHEIGHLVFGWPDLYDTDYSSAGIGSWCLMSGGSWGGGGERPVHPSAWCKSNQGWVETVVETTNRQLTLRDVKAGFKIHRLWTDGDINSQEYFLIENRQRTGSDEYLPGTGLLIWHVDTRVDSNTDENHPMIKLMQADGLEQLKNNNNQGDAGDVYPGAANNSRFDSTSKPDSKSYAGADTFVSVTNIPLSTTTMAFDITVKKSDRPPTSKFNANTWYRLKNSYRTATHCLDVINDKDTDSTGRLQMAADGNYSGQYWQLKLNGDKETYSMRTLFLGPNRQLSVQSDKKTPILDPINPEAKGQSWYIGPWDTPDDDTWYLWNADTERHKYLDTMEGDKIVKMNGGNDGRPTQRWSIKPIREITEPGF